VLATRKGRRREAGSEGSVVQNRGLTHRNRMPGNSSGTSGLLTAKSVSIKHWRCRSGRRAAKADGLTSGDLPSSLWGSEEAERRPDQRQESAEGVVAVAKPTAARRCRVCVGSFTPRRPERCPAQAG
jgi:hypothetical protein